MDRGNNKKKGEHGNQKCSQYTLQRVGRRATAERIALSRVNGVRAAGGMIKGTRDHR